MDTIVEQQGEENTPLDESTEQMPSEPGEGEDEWLDLDDTRQIEAALIECKGNKRNRKADLIVAAVAAVGFHLALIVAVASISARFQIPVRWRLVRGDPTSHDAASTTGQMQNEEQSVIEPASMSPLPMSPAQSAVQENVFERPQEDASVLQNQTLAAMPARDDAVIGIGASSLPQPVPRFATTRSKFHSAGEKSLATTAPQPLNAALAGETSAPRVAAPKGGPRGNRDGFDSRGLPIPDYPAESRRRGEEGTVVIDVEVMADGSVGSVRVVSDAGHARLAAAAVEKVKTATFGPARQDGKPVVGHILIPYRFTLR
jgi:protein TonB